MLDPLANFLDDSAPVTAEDKSLVFVAASHNPVVGVDSRVMHPDECLTFTWNGNGPRDLAETPIDILDLKLFRIHIL